MDVIGCVRSWDGWADGTKQAFVPELHSLMKFSPFPHLYSACCLWLQESAPGQPGPRVCPPGPHGYFTAQPPPPPVINPQMISPVWVYLILLNEQCESPSDRWKLSIGQDEKVSSRVPCQCLHADNYTRKLPLTLVALFQSHETQLKKQWVFFSFKIDFSLPLYFPLHIVFFSRGLHTHLDGVLL